MSRGVRGLLVTVRRVAIAITLTATATGLPIAGYVYLARSPALTIRHVVIEGTGGARAAEIQSLLGLTLDETTPSAASNLLFADLGQVRLRAESHPWVARAKVKRDFPDTIRLLVEERVPAMALALDRLYFVDAGGTPFKAIAPGEPYDLPVLTGVTREELAGSREAIVGALELLETLRGNEASSVLPEDEVSEIVWEGAEGYSVVTMDGEVRVRFGTGDYARKVAKLRRAREAGARWGGASDAVRSIDLTYASRVIVGR